MKLQNTIVRIAFLLLLPISLPAQWAPKQTPIKTQWAKDVDLNNPLPEYPRPQMVRADWLCLNGYWEFKSGLITDTVPHNQTLSGKIVVPFPIESTLSGVVKHYDRLWYRKLFTVPANWSGKRILLHFDAIDWESEVFINGISMGIHKGGYDAFSYDITGQITASGPQEVIVRVYDPTRDYGQPRGKQTTAPSGALYTCVTGIWQTVWLEPVSDKSISSLKLIPDIDKGLLAVTVNTSDSTGLTVTATAKDGGSVIGTVNAGLNKKFTISIPNAKLWSPDSPFLYDLTILVKKGDAIVDSVSSYFGMRKISLNTVGKGKKILLNNKSIFQIGPLDQGFWPEGIYTAPTDNALKSDIEQEKALGFNMVRKHIKVEPDRWYYWADKLGILVWQDMPSANSYDTPAGVITDQAAHTLEMTRMINNHINCPSIIMWVLFNEACGQYDIAGQVSLTKSLDPSRLADQGSGGQISNPSSGDVLDVHNYPYPLCLVTTTQAPVCGEYGGIAYLVPNHQWGIFANNSGWAQSSSELVATYSGLADQVINFKTNNNLNAAVYTQITDVETEINGLFTYDRNPKADVNLIRTINERMIHQNVVKTIDILPTSQITAQSWKYTTTQPASSWVQTNFADTGWNTGLGGFGTAGTPGAVIKTNWNTTDIWMRKQFYVTDLTKNEFPKIVFNIHHDDDCEIYINGVLAASTSGYTSNYSLISINNNAKNALKLNGKNTIAVHCLQKTGGQFIDVGIVKLVLSSDTTNAYRPAPAYGSTNINTDITLSWIPGNLASSHKVYIGTNAILSDTDLVSSQTDTTFNVTNLKPGVTYYWRVDEVCNSVVKTGYLWNFTTKATTGVNNPLISFSTAYPNPLKKGEILYLDLTIDRIENIEVWSNNGTLLFKQPVNDRKKVSVNFQSHNLAAGIYFIRAERNGGSFAPMKIIYGQ